MPLIDPHLTLGALVTEHPALVRELERLRLDYCCRGQRSLQDACRDRGLDPAAVAKALAESTAIDAGSDSWATMGPAELVDHLEATHHAYLWRELPHIATLADKVTAAHSDRHPELAAVREVLRELRAELEPHLTREEQVLFPSSATSPAQTGPARGPAPAARPTAPAATAPCLHPRPPCGGSVRNPISVMLREHDRAGDLLDRLRTLTAGYTPPADGCASYVAYYRALADLESDIHLDVHKENNLLFPAVVALEAQTRQG